MGGISSPVGFKKTGTSKLLEKDFEVAKKMLEIEQEFPEMKLLVDGKEKAEFLHKKIAEMRREVEGKRRQASKHHEDYEYLTLQKNVFDAISSWGKSELKIQKPDGLSFRVLRKAVAEGKTVYFTRDIYAKVPAIDFEKEVFRFAEIQVIEHDWAGAFKNADISDAIVKLPYDVCAFEFKFSGRPVVVFATEFNADIAFSLAIPHDGIWMLMDCSFALSNTEEDTGEEGILILIGLVRAQIRAACIALDAEVAVSEVVREPHISNHGRNSHQSLKPYHVVSLAHRGPRPLPSVGHETGRRVRLHFRRGHWRHFESSKTWIKWMLVGDPDLGFVDKHYKL